MQIGFIAGKIGKDATLATTQAGEKVSNFSVAVDTWNGKEKGTQWWRVSLWGKRAESLSPYLLKGCSVSVTGPQSLEMYNGEPQLNIRASEVTLQGQRGQGSGGGEQAQQQQTNPGGGSGFGDDLDDDIPF